MVTIEHLEVRFDVEGEGDEAVFGRLFERHMRRWRHEEAAEAARRCRARADRALGDRLAGGGGEW